MSGLIPARAGNTAAGSNSHPPAGAHPRSRGEHSGWLELSPSGGGSSPLARGTQRLARTLTLRRGLIPARAGNTAAGSNSHPPAGAHPRSRGEHAAIPCMDWNVSGSSPLARGTLFSFCCGAAAPGLIPARAGNTVDIAAVHKPSRAHPRSRGEHSTSSAVLVSRLGSSPLARGTRWVTSWITDPCGLIPARAGNT